MNFFKKCFFLKRNSDETSIFGTTEWEEEKINQNQSWLIPTSTLFTIVYRVILDYYKKLRKNRLDVHEKQFCFLNFFLHDLLVLTFCSKKNRCSVLMTNDDDNTRKDIVISEAVKSPLEFSAFCTKFFLFYLLCIYFY